MCSEDYYVHRCTNIITIRLTIKYKAALTTCEHKYRARLCVVLFMLDVLYCYDVCTPLLDRGRSHIT